MTKEELIQLQYRYETGQYSTVAELATEYGIKEKALAGRIYQGKWKVKQQELQIKLQKKLEERVISKAQLWEEKVSSRMVKDWSIVDKSLNNIAPIDEKTGELSENVLGVDGVELLNLLRSRKLIDDMARRSLGMVDPAQSVDITSKGQSLGESFASAMEKMRSNAGAIPKEMIESVIEAQVIEEESENKS